MELEGKRVGLQGEIQEIEKYLENTYISPDFRDSLEKAYRLEQDIEKLK